MTRTLRPTGGRRRRREDAGALVGAALTADSAREFAGLYRPPSNDGTAGTTYMEWLLPTRSTCIIRASRKLDDEAHRRERAPGATCLFPTGSWVTNGGALLDLALHPSAPLLEAERIAFGKALDNTGTQILWIAVLDAAHKG